MKTCTDIFEEDKHDLNTKVMRPEEDYLKRWICT